MENRTLTHWRGKALADMSRQELIELAQFLYEQCLVAADSSDEASKVVAMLLKKLVRPKPRPHLQR